MDSKLLRKIIVTSFIVVPIISSVISALHIVDFFQLGNPTWLAVALAISIELGSIASFLTLSILDKLSKGIVWTVFIILFLMQIIGNMYFSFEFITIAMEKDANWINSFKMMAEFFLGEMELNDVKMYLTILISWPIPLISVFLLKSAVDYLKPEEVKIATPAKEGVSFYDLKAEDRNKLRNKLKTEITNEEEDKYTENTESEKITTE
jgi:hypothetical protein